ncbi:MAG: hypothetical protein ACI81O_000272 [Cyclobacteriaceae bacterium]|jgi:hypothetical protein
MSVPPITVLADEQSLPWYQYRWPWVLLAIPMSAVAFGIVMISTALIYPDDLVVDNYYKEGMAINRTLLMDANAVALGVTAVIDVRPGGMVTLALAGASDAVVTASLFHVTDRAKDQFVVLYPEIDSPDISSPSTSANLPQQTQRYTGQDTSMATSLSSPGIWYLELRGSEQPWRVRQRIQTPIQVLEITPR